MTKKPIPSIPPALGVPPKDAVYTDPPARHTTPAHAVVEPPEDRMIRLLASALIKEYRVLLPDRTSAITELTDEHGARILILATWDKPRGRKS